MPVELDGPIVGSLKGDNAPPSSNLPRLIARRLRLLFSSALLDAKITYPRYLGGLSSPLNESEIRRWMSSVPRLKAKEVFPGTLLVKPQYTAVSCMQRTGQH